MVTVQRIRDWLRHYPEVMVELTGGEPLLQENIYPLLDHLIAEGRPVLVETNGSLSIEKIPSQVSVILDIKCPDSGMDARTDWENIARLAARKNSRSRDEVKFVISSEKDFFWAKNIIEEYRLHSLATILLSPVEYLFAPVNLADLILEHRLPARLQVQLHRLLWPGRNRGV